MTTADGRSRWPWILALTVAVAVPFLVLASTHGQCFDSAAGPDASSCSSGPSVGWPGAWLIVAACVALFVVSARRLFRLRHGRD